jgi:site-specific recombinase XerD
MQFVKLSLIQLGRELKSFAPYCLRHTALTNLASQCDSFALQTIAGHSSISITQRYVHPQAKAITEAFQKIRDLQRVVIVKISPKNKPSRRALQRWDS